MRILDTLSKGLIGLGFLCGLAGPVAAETVVDVELVLAVDISYSMDEDELRLQRNGYAEAITSPQVMAAIANGAKKRIAIAYVEWAGAAEQRLVVDWTLVDGPDSARAFADKLLAQPYRRAYRTSISGALTFSAPLFDQNAYLGTRLVIDISGDGANNQGLLVEEARDATVRQGIVINGLPILIKRPNFSTMDLGDLDRYYEDCVIGGEGSFMVPIKSREQFGAAIRMKLIMEIADLAPRQPPVRRVATANQLCTEGERMWRERMEWMRN